MLLYNIITHVTPSKSEKYSGNVGNDQTMLEDISIAGVIGKNFRNWPISFVNAFLYTYWYFL